MGQKMNSRLKARRAKKTPARIEMLNDNDVLTDGKERDIAASYRDEFDTWLR